MKILKKDRSASFQETGREGFISKKSLYSLQ
jgi:hypothetical protein